MKHWACCSISGETALKSLRAIVICNGEPASGTRRKNEEKLGIRNCPDRNRDRNRDQRDADSGIGVTGI
jgi:hypothetical protein